MGHWEDKVYHILEDVGRLGVQKEFDKETDRLRAQNTYMETRDLFELALANILKNKDKDE